MPQIQHIRNLVTLASLRDAMSPDILRIWREISSRIDSCPSIVARSAPSEPLALEPAAPLGAERANMERARVPRANMAARDGAS